ncbi:hypothetical protein HZS92_03787 [Xanthomonas citri pv. citri]|nr:hypothetical protein HZS92_03787 [Xanthomonas citri pv. citri]
MDVEARVKRSVARRDKPCAAGPGWPPGQGAQRGIGAPQGAPGGLAVSGTKRTPSRRHAGPAPHRWQPTHFISTCMTRSRWRLTPRNSKGPDAVGPGPCRCADDQRNGAIGDAPR